MRNRRTVFRKSFFNQREWYIRLVLEGEDRLSRNRESKEQGWTISYSDVSEEWGMLQTEEKVSIGDAGWQRVCK